MSALALLVRRLSRYMVIYASGSLLNLLLGLGITAVITHAVGPADYGRLALLLFFASLLTILINLGSMQGAFRLVFGGGDLDGGGEDARSEGLARVDQQRRAMGTAILVTVGVGLVALGVSAAFAPQISKVLLGSTSFDTLVLLAAGSAVLASTWRLIANLLRYDRRPGAYVVTEVSRPAAVLVAAVVLLANTGRPLESSLESYVIGGAAAVLAAVLFARKDFTLSFVPRYAVQVFSLGGSITPVVLAFFFMQSADVLLLSFYAASAVVGAYRVAGSLATPASYAVAAFLLAWGPLTRSPLQTALGRERGERNIGAMLALYYVIGACWTLIAVTGLAYPLSHVVPTTYRGAVKLVPLLALVAIARGCLVIVYRVSEYRTSRNWFIGASAFGSVAWLSLSLVLVPALGAYGAALAPSVGFFLASAVLVGRSQLGAAPVPFPWVRLAAAAIIAAAFVLVERWLFGRNNGVIVPVLTGLLMIIYPLLLLGLRVVPREHRPEIWAIVRRGGGGGGRTAEYGRLREIDPQRAHEVEQFVRSGGDGLDEEGPVSTRRLIAALAEIADVEPPLADDAPMVARYLSARLPVAERDRLGQALIYDHGIDPLVLDKLSECVSRLRRIPRRMRPVLRRGGSGA